MNTISTTALDRLDRVGRRLNGVSAEDVVARLPWATISRAGTYNAANEETPTQSAVPATTPPAT